jgi:hypothetical protein
MVTKNQLFIIPINKADTTRCFPRSGNSFLKSQLAILK